MKRRSAQKVTQPHAHWRRKGSLAHVHGLTRRTGSGHWSRAPIPDNEYEVSGRPSPDTIGRFPAHRA
jgi:hypothetical protein